jgi:hypothetical protein
LKTSTLSLVAVVSTALLAACGERRSAEGGGLEVLATVNGVPITERDVAHRTERPGTPAMPGHEPAAAGNALPTIVQDELVYQRAVELGLDRDPEYLRRVADLEAQVRTFRRQQMTMRVRAWAQEQVKVTEQEARDWFDRNAALVTTRFHVLQIFYRGRAEQILADRADIRSGAPFEEVAWRRFDGVPRQGKAPWDLGELAWHQLPPAWRGVVDQLEPGQVSEVIRDGDRAWVIKLAAKRVDPALGFATERERIDTALRQRKAEAQYASVVAEARKRAKIVYTADGGAGRAIAITASRAAEESAR